MTDVTSANEVMRRLLEKGIKTVVISSTELGDDNMLLAMASTVDGNSVNLDSKFCMYNVVVK